MKKADLSKPHIHIDGVPVNLNVAKNANELLAALEYMVNVFEGSIMHPQGSIEAIRCSQAREAIRKAKA